MCVERSLIPSSVLFCWFFSWMEKRRARTQLLPCNFVCNALTCLVNTIYRRPTQTPNSRLNAITYGELFEKETRWCILHLGNKTNFTLFPLSVSSWIESKCLLHASSQMRCGWANDAHTDRQRAYEWRIINVDMLLFVHLIPMRQPFGMLENRMRLCELICAH